MPSDFKLGCRGWCLAALGGGVGRNRLQPGPPAARPSARGAHMGLLTRGAPLPCASNQRLFCAATHDVCLLAVRKLPLSRRPSRAASDSVPAAAELP